MVPQKGRLRRTRLRGGAKLVIALTLSLLGACQTSNHRTETRRVYAQPDGPAHGPNILLVIADDLAANVLGVDGAPHKATPRLDALAHQGVWFSKAYCNAPLCTPSRQALITGRLPHANGVTRLNTPLAEYETTLGDWFSDLGYRTAAYGKMHFHKPGAKHGFNDRLDVEEYETFLKDHPPPGGDHRPEWKPLKSPASVWLNSDRVAQTLPREWMDSEYFVDRASAFFQNHKNDDTPFLMVVGLYDPHAPFKFPVGWNPVFKPEDFPVPTPSESDLQEQPEVFRDLTPRQIQGIQAAYLTAVSFTDYEIGRLIDALDAAGLAENTIVVVVGDNGYMKGEHGRFEKHCHYEGSSRIPLIFRWKGHLPENLQVGELVEMIDLFPTLTDLTGQAQPTQLHGHSLAPLLHKEPDANGEPYIFSEYLENEEAMVRDARYKLIVGTGLRRRLDGYDTGRPLPGPYQKLFDLQTDPGETKNLIDRPELAEVKDRLLQNLFDRITSTRNDDDQVPPGLDRLQAIHWCLHPRD